MDLKNGHVYFDKFHLNKIHLVEKLISVKVKGCGMWKMASFTLHWIYRGELWPEFIHKSCVPKEPHDHNLVEFVQSSQFVVQCCIQMNKKYWKAVTGTLMK